MKTEQRRAQEQDIMNVTLELTQQEAAEFAEIIIVKMDALSARLEELKRIHSRLVGTVSDDKSVIAVVKPVADAEDKQKAATTPIGGPINRVEPVNTEKLDALQMNTWMVNKWDRNILVKGSPVRLKCPRAVSGRWASTMTVQQLIEKLAEAVKGESLRIFHDKKDVQATWEPVYNFALSLKSIDACNGSNLLDEFWPDLTKQQLSRENAR